MKITGGTLSVKEVIPAAEAFQDGENAGGPETDHKGSAAISASGEKVDQIRVYSGEKYELLQTAAAGQVVAVTGLSETKAGMGLGVETEEIHPVLSAVMI